MKEIARKKSRYGYCRDHTLLRPEELIVNLNHLDRIWLSNGILGLQKRRLWKISGSSKNFHLVKTPARPSEIWPDDFLPDQLSDGRTEKKPAFVGEPVNRIPALRPGYGRADSSLPLRVVCVQRGKVLPRMGGRR